MIDLGDYSGILQYIAPIYRFAWVAALADWLSQRHFSWFNFSAALAGPLLVIMSRNESRIRRLKNLQDFIEAYPSADRAKKDRNSPTTDNRDPSLEFVKSKYLADAYVPKKYRNQFDDGDSRAKIRILIRHSRAIGSIEDFKLFLASLGFAVLCYFGFAILFSALAIGLRSGAVEANAACSDDVNGKQLLIIAALAFTGAYVAAIRAFMRGLAVFDLSAYTFLRQTIELIASVALIIFAFKAAPHPFQSIGNLLSHKDSVIKCTEIAWYWYALAPVLALLPESSSNFLFTRVERVLTWIKRNDDRFHASTRIVPLDAIEGIDYFVRFRLEECGIHDVQNLATYNPILLSVESPYNIYQCVDWIGQAQLCHIIGLDRFLLLREMHVRTIFDLERALDFQTTPKDNTATEASSQSDRERISPDEFDEIYAGILFACTETMREVSKISGVSPLVPQADGGTFLPEKVDNYCTWARQYISKEKATKKCVEHLMGWISDDLHVRRLRRIWQEMSDNLGERSERLDNPRPRPSECEPGKPHADGKTKAEASLSRGTGSSEKETNRLPVPEKGEGTSSR